MFREITRKKQALSHEECIDILRSALRGTLALNGECGYPYAMPINFYFDPEKEIFYFHSGKSGYKIDCIARSQKACFTVCDDGVRLDGEWWLTIRSVIAFGKIEIIEDRETIERISRLLSEKFTTDEEYIDREIEKYASATTLIALSVEHMTGKNRPREIDLTHLRRPPFFPHGRHL